MMLFWTPYCLMSLLASLARADGVQLLAKREDKLPYDMLPNTNCAVPDVCSNIGQLVSCRCSSLLTVCLDNDRHFCWGSTDLNRSTDCPIIPVSCSSQFNGTASCLCNQDTVLCVDSYNHYCYGTYTGPTSNASVALQPISAQQTSPSNSPHPASSKAAVFYGPPLLAAAAAAAVAIGSTDFFS